MNKNSLKNILKRIQSVFSLFLLLFAVISFYIFAMMTVELYAAEQSAKISNQKQLNFHLNEEKKKLSLENVKIEAEMNQSASQTYSQKIGYNQYKIILSPSGQNLATLKHELFHIADNHCDDKTGAEPGFSADDIKFKARYLLVYEPKAVVYSIK